MWPKPSTGGPNTVLPLTGSQQKEASGGQTRPDDATTPRGRPICCLAVNGPPAPRVPRACLLCRVGLDRPEAVRAVDRAIHPRLERYLGLIAAGRAENREVLAHRTVVTALVSARPSDVADVVAAVAARPSAGSAARAAF